MTFVYWKKISTKRLTFSNFSYYTMNDKNNCNDDFIKKGLKKGEGIEFNEAIKCLDKICKNNIVNWVVGKGGSKDDAMDVFQDSIVRFLEKLKNKKIIFTSTVCAFLFGIAKNVWRNRLKKKGKLISEEPKDIPIEPEIEITQEQLDEELRFDMVEMRFTELSEICQGILLDFYKEGMSCEEIAEKRGYKSAQVARQRKFICLENLRKKL